MRIFFLLAITLCLAQAAPVLAVDSRALPPSPYAGLPAAPLVSRPVVPQPQAPTVATPAANAPYVPLPPRLPAFLPSGGANLDEAWIQDGGARLYWNTLVIPRQLRMGGASFVDPASVPELLPPDSDKVVRPSRRRRAAAAPVPGRNATPVAAPAGVSSTALKPPVAKASPAVPKASSAPSVSAGAAAPYTGAAPTAVPASPVPLPIAPVDPVPPQAPAMPR